MRATVSAVLAASVARPFFRVRDLAAVWREPVLRGAYHEIWRAHRRAPPHKLAFEAVRRVRAQGIDAGALTWGETPFSTARDVLRDAGVGPDSTVVDLGAGRGMVLLAARALGACARGVELDSARVWPVRDALARAGVDLAVGDAREADIRAATHIWLSWTCMPSALRAALVERLDALAVGARVVSLTWSPVAHAGDGSAPLALVRETRRLFPWGWVDVIISERTSELSPAQAREG